MQIRDLDHNEQLALGGLIRILVRLDGSFSEEEEQRIHEVGENLGGSEMLWKVISMSAQELTDDDAIRKAARGVEREAARETIFDSVYAIAEAGTITSTEGDLLDWIADSWDLPSWRTESE